MGTGLKCINSFLKICYFLYLQYSLTKNLSGLTTNHQLPKHKTVGLGAPRKAGSCITATITTLETSCFKEIRTLENNWPVDRDGLPVWPTQPVRLWQLVKSNCILNGKLRQINPIYLTLSYFSPHMWSYKSFVITWKIRKRSFNQIIPLYCELHHMQTQ